MDTSPIWRSAGSVSGEGEPPATLRRVLLVGFMASGKSTVGPRLARRLGWRFADFDDEIAAAEGMSIRDIFRTRGEDYFRRVEAELGQRLLEREEVVLAAGGGWAAMPGRLDEIPEGTETFWLRVTADEAVRRASGRPGARPLLAGNAPSARAQRLLAEREPSYRRAGTVVDTDGRSVEDVTTEILGILGGKYPEVPRSKA